MKTLPRKGSLANHNIINTYPCGPLYELSMVKGVLMQFYQIFWSVSVLVTVCMPAIGAPSGLNVIPTADILDSGVVSLETESTGTGSPWGGDCNSFTLLQFGMGYGIELGMDKCVNDSDSWINFKWRVRDEAGAFPAIAFGTQAISKGDRSQHFAVATKSFGKCRLHTGVIGIDRSIRWMLGANRPISGRLTFQTDYINGDENSSTFGVALALNGSLSLTVARSLGNSVDAGDGYIVNAAWSKGLNKVLRFEKSRLCDGGYFLRRVAQ
jgi:hypothetical protein